MSVGLITRILALLVGLALSAGAIWTVFFVDWSRELPVPEPIVRPVRTLAVGEALTSSRTFPARVRATNEVTLAFQVTGVLRELPLTRGQRVKEGDLLAQLDLRDFQNRLEQANVQLEQLTVELGAVTRAFNLDAATSIEMARMRASVDVARMGRDIAQKSLEDATLRAPFDGVVADVFADNFQKVAPGTRVVRIQGSKPVRVEVNVDSTRIALNRAFESSVEHVVRFDFAPGREFPAKLAEFTTEADPTTQTFLAIFEITTPEEIYVLPGMTGTLIERTPMAAPSATGAMTVPSSAVVIDGVGSPYVWLVGDTESDGTATVRRKRVSVGEISGDSIVVTKGLEHGVQIVVAGARELDELQRVRPVEAPAGSTNESTGGASVGVTGR